MTSYLQWVGLKDYPTSDIFLKEVKQGGLFKKLPNSKVAISLTKSNPLIYLAHSEGRMRTCLACSKLVPCTECMNMPDPMGGPATACKRCKGLGSYEVGTGGFAEVDGVRWDYVRYIRLKRQPWHEFWTAEHDIGDVKPCDQCGGRGKIPLGGIFAAYIPNEIVKVGDPKERAPLSLQGIRLIPWSLVAKPISPQNGRELQVGFYAKTYPTAWGPKRDTNRAQAIWQENSEELTSIGVAIERCDGNFLVLEDPVAYTGKQFRGIKRWSPLDGDS